MAPHSDDPPIGMALDETQLLAAATNAKESVCRYFALRRERAEILERYRADAATPCDLARFRHVRLTLRMWDSPGRLPHLPDTLLAAVQHHNELMRESVGDEVVGPAVAT